MNFAFKGTPKRKEETNHDVRCNNERVYCRRSNIFILGALYEKRKENFQMKKSINYIFVFFSMNLYRKYE